MNVAKTIAIDARPFSGGHSGYTTYLSSMIRILSASHYEITLVSNKSISDYHKNLTKFRLQIFGSTKDRIWEKRDLGGYLCANKYDLYFSGANRGIPKQVIPHTRKILGLLDTIPYKFAKHYMFKFPFHFVRKEMLAQLSSVKNADSIITISKNSAKDINKLFKREARPFLIPIDAPMMSLTETPKKELVYIGGVDPRKKIDNLIKAFAKFQNEHPDFKLILVGTGYRVFDKLIEQYDQKNNILMPGIVSDREKYSILNQCTSVVYPSIYEGYGLAIAETIVANCPIIAGKGGAQAEVGGEAMLVIDPMDIDSIYTAMKQVLQPEVRKKLCVARLHKYEVLAGAQLKRSIAQYFDSEVKKAQS